MRAGLARAVCTQMMKSPAMAVDDTCEAAIRENILHGQPAGIPCPHKDCGILAVRVYTPGGLFRNTGGRNRRYHANG